MKKTVTEKPAKSEMQLTLNRFIVEFKQNLGNIYIKLSKLNPEERKQVEKSFDNFLKDMNRTIRSAEHFLKHQDLDMYEEHINKTCF